MLFSGFFLSYTLKYYLSPHLDYKTHKGKNHFSFFDASHIACSIVLDIFGC